MSELPPLLRDQRKADEEHLKLLAVFHFVLASFAVLGILFLILHYTVMSTVMSNPDMWKNQKMPPNFDPKQVFGMLKWFYLFMASMFVLGGMANIVSGFCIRARRGRIFSLIIAGVNCFMVPFGTALGIFTFVVLLRDSVREVYQASTSNVEA